MPPDAQHPGSPEGWMRYAKADLALARVPLSKDGMYELLCSHAQQAAEKSLKAVLIHYGVEPLRTHNLERLINLLPAHISCASELNEKDPSR
jgi:HEPN domain-containing protein